MKKLILTTLVAALALTACSKETTNNAADTAQSAAADTAHNAQAVAAEAEAAASATADTVSDAADRGIENATNTAQAAADVVSDAASATADAVTPNTATAEAQAPEDQKYWQPQPSKAPKALNIQGFCLSALW